MSAANSDTTPLLGGAAAAPAPEAAATPVSPPAAQQQQQQQQGGYAAYPPQQQQQGKDGMGSASGNLYQQPPPGYPGYGPPPGMQQYQQLPPGSGYASTTYTTYQPAPVVQIAQPGQTVYASVTTYGNLPIFRDVPVTITCRHCQVTGPTKVDFSAGLMTWLICGGVSLFGLICGCCLVPFFMDSTKVRQRQTRPAEGRARAVAGTGSGRGRGRGRVRGRGRGFEPWHGQGTHARADFVPLPIHVSLQDAVHTCSSCNQVVGTYKRM